MYVIEQRLCSSVLHHRHVGRQIGNSEDGGHRTVLSSFCCLDWRHDVWDFVSILSVASWTEDDLQIPKFDSFFTSLGKVYHFGSFNAFCFISKILVKMKIIFWLSVLINSLEAQDDSDYPRKSFGCFCAVSKKYGCVLKLKKLQFMQDFWWRYVC